MKKFSMLFLLLFLGVMLLNVYTTINQGQSLYQLMQTAPTYTEEEIQYLKQKKVLRYGADSNAPPLRSVNQSTGQYEGIVIDYLNALSLELSTNIDKKPMVWSEALESLKQGKIDFCDMHPSDARSLYYDFTDPIYHQRGGILVSKENTRIQAIEDLEGKKIAAIKDDYVIEHVKANYHSVQIETHADLKQAIQSLEAGQVDAVLGDESVIHFFLVEQGLNNRYALLDGYLYEREAVLGVKKGDTLLLSILNKAISQLDKKDTMKQITDKWSPLITRDDDTQTINQLVIYSVIIIISICLLFFLWNYELKKQIQLHTTALRESKHILETTFNGLSNHFLLLVDSNCTVLEANNALCSFLGISHSEILGKHCYDINGILGIDCSACIIRQSISEHRTIRREFKHHNRIFSAQSYYLSEVMHTPCALIMFEDITELKIASQKMQQTSKMEALGQLSAGIAHEVRTPLGIIRNSTYLLKKTSLEPKASEMVENIEQATTRANKIIDNLLNFSRISDYQYKEMSIESFINDIIKLHVKSLEKRNITIELDRSLTWTALLPVEPLKHVFINLINNASDAMPNGGCIKIKGNVSNDFFHFEVEDNGEGILEDHLPFIFDPFYTTKPSGQGTGLGLYVVYTEIEKLKGSIAVESTLGKGTTFIVTIPKGES